MGSGLSQRQHANLRLQLRIVLVSAVGGAIYGVAITLGEAGELYLGGIVQGLFTGAFIAAWCSSFDFWLPSLRIGRWLRQLSFSRYITAKTIYYVAGIDGGIFLGQNLFAPLYGGTPWSPGDPAFIATFLGAMVVAGAVNFLMEMNILLGRNVLINFLTGRYHQPREEQRVFLFVDMVDSTQHAERLGHLEFHRMLADFFADLTDPIMATHGEIHAYVGDQVIVTWPLSAGVRDGNCVRCLLLMRRALAAREAHYAARYGISPEFRAALHAGPVVTGEMGEQKRQIVFLGDTVNTTARLEQAARDLDMPAVVSGELLRQIELPDGLTAISLGAQRLRGKESAVELFGLDPAQAPTASEAA